MGKILLFNNDEPSSPPRLFREYLEESMESVIEQTMFYKTYGNRNTGTYLMTDMNAFRPMCILRCKNILSVKYATCTQFFYRTRRPILFTGAAEFSTGVIGITGDRGGRGMPDGG